MNFSNLSELVISALVLVLPLFICVAYLVYAERKVIAWMQLRVGPSVVGPFGLFQSFADAIKAMCKEVIIPTQSRVFLFLLAPIITFTIAVLSWAVIPLSSKIVFANLDLGVLYIMAMSSIGVYGVIIAGYASNSQYALLGAIRSASQMISYEISIGLGIVCVAIMSESLNLTQIVNNQANCWYCIPLFPIFVIFFISIVAETNRHPFDLPEAEAELVAGYNVEYSSIPFTLFFLGEYMNMIMMSTFCSILFLGGWLPPFAFLDFIPGFVWLALKVMFLLYLFIAARAAYPRYRYDQLIRIVWKWFLPIGLIYIIGLGFFKLVF
jgi:NADH-quinone oxidoreductase subunit H